METGALTKLWKMIFEKLEGTDILRKSERYLGVARQQVQGNTGFEIYILGAVESSTVKEG